MNWWALAGAVLSGTALATVLGKLIDLWWLEPKKLKAERLRWLREVRLQAYASLSEELLSMGVKSRVWENYQLFRAKAARAELLTDDAQLLQDLRELSKDLFLWSIGKSHGVEVLNFPEGSVRLPDGTPITRKDVERVEEYGDLEKRANDLVVRLGRAVRSG